MRVGECVVSVLFLFLIVFLLFFSLYVVLVRKKEKKEKKYFKKPKKKTGGPVCYRHTYDTFPRQRKHTLSWQSIACFHLMSLKVASRPFSFPSRQTLEQFNET